MHKRSYGCRGDQKAAGAAVRRPSCTGICSCWQANVEQAELFALQAASKANAAIVLVATHDIQLNLRSPAQFGECGSSHGRRPFGRQRQKMQTPQAPRGLPILVLVLVRLNDPQDEWCQSESGLCGHPAAKSRCMRCPRLECQHLMPCPIFRPAPSSVQKQVDGSGERPDSSHSTMSVIKSKGHESG